MAVELGETIEITVKAKNNTRRKIEVPYYSDPGDNEGRKYGILMGYAGVVFVRELPYTGLGFDSLNHISYEALEPGEARTYRFYWRGDPDDVGSGYLVVTLPENFTPVAPQPIIVKVYAEQADDGVRDK